MPRVLQVLALLIAFLVVGAPAWVAELVEDDCGEGCTGDESAGGCEEQGCTDCSVVCGSCARTHLLPAVAAVSLDRAVIAYVDAASDATDRMPAGPAPEGIFHPPRAG